MSIINQEAPLQVKHLLWAMGIFKAVIGAGIWFGIWYIGSDIEKAVSPLQTKSTFNEWKKANKKEWDEWKEKEWNTHIKEANNSSVSIGILLDRTNSRAASTNSTGMNGMHTAAPPQ